MGFLDLLSKKNKGGENKSNNSIPPPAPGPGKEGVINAKNEEGQSNQPPQPNMNQPSQDNATKTQQQGGIPSFSPGKELPKLELPTFPGSNNQNSNQENLSVPSFNQNSQENNTQEPQKTNNSEASVPPVQNQENVAPIDQFSPSQKTRDSGFKDLQGNPIPEQVLKSHQDISGNEPAPWDNQDFLSQGEHHINEMKRNLHSPNEEVGTDNSRIGNVENKVKKKIKEQGGPLFVEINNYKNILNSVDEIKRDLGDSQEYLNKLDEFNGKKNTEFERWKKTFENIHTKLTFVDKTLFKSDQ